MTANLDHPVSPNFGRARDTMPELDATEHLRAAAARTMFPSELAARGLHPDRPVTAGKGPEQFVTDALRDRDRFTAPLPTREA